MVNNFISDARIHKHEIRNRRFTCRLDERPGFEPRTNCYGFLFDDNQSFGQVFFVRVVVAFSSVGTVLPMLRNYFHLRKLTATPVPLAARSKSWVCGRSLAEIAGSNPTGVYGCLSVVSVVCCQVEVSATS